MININSSKSFAQSSRRVVLELARKATLSGKGAHLGGSLSVIDILAVLMCQGGVFQPHSGDRLILSKGHASLALYSALYLSNQLPLEAIESYPSDDSPLQGHPIRCPAWGIPFSTGSLGMGLSFASGLAISNRLVGNESASVFVILGDGECNEGSVWEGLLFVRRHDISRLVVIIDENGFQQTGSTSEVGGKLELCNIIKAIGIQSFEVDGHNHEELCARLAVARVATQPTVLLCKTIKGKGVDFMESNNSWHHSQLSEKQLTDALSRITIDKN